MISERPAQATKAPVIPQMKKIVPIKIGPRVWPNRRTIPFIGINPARYFMGTIPDRSVWTLGNMMPWPIP